MTYDLNRRILPGYPAALGFTVVYLTVLVLVPLGATILKASSLSWREFLAVAWSPRAQIAYALSFSASFFAALLSIFLGTLVAWVLVRYEFAGKSVVDALVDLPLALPTAVAGLVYSSLYAKNGWLGEFLVPLGIHVAYSRLAIVLVLTFIGLPFVVRTVQTVLADVDAELEEVAASLGASPLQTAIHILLPAVFPALVTGFALAFARGLGEYGSIVFVSGNIPYKTEIAPVLIVASLEAFQYREAAAIGVVLLGTSLITLVLINRLERWGHRHG